MKENFGQFIMAENIAGYMPVMYDGDGDGGVSERMDPVNVLVLGGWSMSCLDRLRREFRSQCVFYEPTLYMPPVDCASLFMWESMLFASVIILLVSLVSAQSWPSQLLHGLLLLQLPLGIALLLAMPRLVALVARGAIRQSVAIAAAAIEKHAIDLVMGYSWGGGIGCFLLIEGHWSGPTLLLAPTVNAMAGAARLPTVSSELFLAPHAGNPAELSAVAAEVEQRHPAGAAPAVAGHPSPAVCIFHADKDEFCPESQRLTLEQTGAQCQLMRDTHDLMAPPSKEAISRAFAGLLARARPDCFSSSRPAA